MSRQHACPPPYQLKQLQSTTVAATLLDATTIRRKRGPSLSRRIGQTGQRVSAFTEMESSGPELTGATGLTCRAQRRKRQNDCAWRLPLRAASPVGSSVSTSKPQGINSKQTFTSTTAPATTFRAQAAKWIHALSTRRRKPVKPATISGWQHSLDKWVLAESWRPTSRGRWQCRAKRTGRKNVLCGAFPANHRHSLEGRKDGRRLGCKFRRRTDSPAQVESRFHRATNR